MPADGHEPIADDETLYRRIPEFPESHYQPDSDRPLAWVAFRPNERDVDGLSVWRAKYVTLEQAASGRSGKSYYVVLLKAGELRELGCVVVPTPDVGTGHASITNMSSNSYAENKNDVRNMAERIAAAFASHVEGPFHTD